MYSPRIMGSGKSGHKQVEKSSKTNCFQNLFHRDKVQYGFDQSLSNIKHLINTIKFASELHSVVPQRSE